MRLLKVRPPYPVIVFAVLAAAVVLAALVHEGPRGRWVGAGLLLLIATFGLIQGVWAAWLFLVVVGVGDIVVAVPEWPDWAAAQIIALNGFMLALLLASLDQAPHAPRQAAAAREARIRPAYVSAGTTAPTLSASPCSNT